jgi:hypothetical protein
MGAFCLSTKTKCPECPGYREVRGGVKAPRQHSGFYFWENDHGKVGKRFGRDCSHGLTGS